MVQVCALKGTIWEWLAPIQESGAALPRPTLVQRCLRDKVRFWMCKWAGGPGAVAARGSGASEATQPQTTCMHQTSTKPDPTANPPPTHPPQPVLKFVCATAEALGAGPAPSRTFLSFYAVTMCEVLAAAPAVPEDLVGDLLPSLVAGISAGE